MPHHRCACKEQRWFSCFLWGCWALPGGLALLLQALELEPAGAVEFSFVLTIFWLVLLKARGFLALVIPDLNRRQPTPAPGITGVVLVRVLRQWARSKIDPF